ncbi:hypothetical protein [Flavobacterium sp. '19STA2R22 D10 B1']|uniref:hypothetical protein n=1 Tax=Flavobacterium aerium TaxID=3037261 RepID=UPI00278BCFBA|nr:hypothetical protein [Flavobacterium sp. '19STA2R22 D10 B1']
MLKKTHFLWINFLLLISMTSCQFSENIYIDEAGTGKIEFDLDGSSIMELAGGQLGSEKDLKNMDSTFVFADLLKNKKDSISLLPPEKQALIKSLEKLTMRMLMNVEKKQMQVTLTSKFDNVNEVHNMMASMKNVSDLDKKSKDTKNPLAALSEADNIDLSYSYNGKVFKRTGKIIDAAAQKMIVDSLEKSKMFLETSMYTLNYHFPRKIKSVSNKKAEISTDKKSLTLGVKYTEYIEKPEVLNLEVVLEKK